MIFNFTNFSSKKCEIKCPESSKKNNDTRQILPYRCGRQTSGEGERDRRNVDTCEQGGGTDKHTGQVKQL